MILGGGLHIRPDSAVPQEVNRRREYGLNQLLPGKRSARDPQCPLGFFADRNLLRRSLEYSASFANELGIVSCYPDFW